MQEDVGSTAHVSQMRNIRFIPINQLIRGFIVESLYGCPVVDMDHIFYTEFPPGPWQTSIMVHCLSLIHIGPIKVFSPAIFLRHMGVIYHFYHFPFLCLYYFSVPFSSLLFHQVPYFPFPFTLLSVPSLCHFLFLSLYYFLCLSSYYFPFCYTSILHSYHQLLRYWYHKHHLSSITFNHVLLTILDSLSPYLLSIPHIIFIPLICLSISL